MIDRALRDKLIDAYVALIPLILLNLVWFIISLPLITLIPATGGLFYATHKLAHGHSADWHTLIEGFRLYFWQSWVVGLISVGLVAVFATNFLFYSFADSGLAVWIRGMVIVLALLWLAIQIYLFPLLMEQEHPHLRLALRNSLVIILKRPLFTLGMTLSIAALMIGTMLVIQPAWIFITASACAFFANQATVSSIGRITGKTASSEQP
ncbi:MAG: YesL family protein [Chloroflexota bacterium]